MNFLNDLSGQELVSFAALFSIALSQGLTSDEIDTLGNFLTAVGTNLTTIAAAMDIDSNKKEQFLQ